MATGSMADGTAKSHTRWQVDAGNSCEHWPPDVRSHVSICAPMCFLRASAAARPSERNARGNPNTTRSARTEHTRSIDPLTTGTSAGLSTSGFSLSLSRLVERPLPLRRRLVIQKTIRFPIAIERARKKHLLVIIVGTMRRRGSVFANDPRLRLLRFRAPNTIKENIRASRHIKGSRAWLRRAGAGEHAPSGACRLRQNPLT